MLKYALIFLSLFSYSLYLYLPLFKSNISFDVDGLCFYQESTNPNLKFVKSCENGYYCNNNQNNNEGFCKKYNDSLIHKFGAECNNNLECDSNLICQDRICSVPLDGSPYSKNSNYFCPSEKFAIKQSDGSYKCEANNVMKGKCYQSSTNTRAFPDFFNVCGEIKDGNILLSEIGKVALNTFVEDEKACESGFALYYFEDKTLNGNSSDFNSKTMNLLCVEFKDAQYIDDNCIIKYSLDGKTELIYNTHNLKNTHKNHFNDCEILNVKVELFKNYLDKMNDDQREKCKSDKLYDEPFTCGNDKLRYFWYFYNHPKDYLLYKDESEVIDYLLRQEYHSYQTIKDSDGFSSFLKYKYLISLLVLLSL